MDQVSCEPISKSEDYLYTDSSIQYILSSNKEVFKTEFLPYELYKDDYKVYTELDQNEYFFLKQLTSIYDNTNELGN